MTDMDIYTPDEEGRTEKATPSRLKKAREEGKVPRSGELTATISVLAAALFLIFWGRRIVAELERLFRYCMEMAVQENGRFEALAAAALGSFCRAVLPLLFVVFGAALAAELAQVGFQASWKPLRFQWNRLRRQKNGRRTGFQLGHALIKSVAVAIVLFLGFRAELPKFGAMLNSPLEIGAEAFAGTAVRILVMAALVLLVLAAVEYVFERIFYASSLRMTRREVLEEMRQESGDPVVKDMLSDKMGLGEKRR